MSGALPDCATWASDDREAIMAKAMSDEVRITAAQDPQPIATLFLSGVRFPWASTSVRYLIKSGID